MHLALFSRGHASSDFLHEAARRASSKLRRVVGTEGRPPASIFLLLFIELSKPPDGKCMPSVDLAAASRAATAALIELDVATTREGRMRRLHACILHPERAIEI